MPTVQYMYGTVNRGNFDVHKLPFYGYYDFQHSCFSKMGTELVF
jgi:hypothetical protein